MEVVKNPRGFSTVAPKWITSLVGGYSCHPATLSSFPNTGESSETAMKLLICWCVCMFFNVFKCCSPWMPGRFWWTSCIIGGSWWTQIKLHPDWQGTHNSIKNCVLWWIFQIYMVALIFDMISTSVSWSHPWDSQKKWLPNGALAVLALVSVLARVGAILVPGEYSFRFDYNSAVHGKLKLATKWNKQQDILL